MSALLEVEDLTKRFGGLEALADVSFSVAEGEIVGIIGPNGAGKTTLFNAVTGFFKPDRGRVCLRGQDITGQAPHRICRQGLARTFQLSKPFPRLTVLQTVRVGALNRISDMAAATARAEEVLDFIGLAHKRDQLGIHLTVLERKRLELARAFATGPALLLLDEVIAGLRPNEVQDMIVLVRKIAAQGITILLIEHVMEAVMSVSSHLIVLNYGRVIAQGPPAELAKHPDVIAAYLGKAYHA